MRRLAPLALSVAGLTLPGAGARASGGGEHADGPPFVAMDEIRAPIVDSDRVTGTLRFKIVLETADAANADRISANLPALRAAALGSALEFARLNASAMRAVDAERLSRDLGAAMRSADTGIARVLIVEVAAEPS